MKERTNKRPTFARIEFRTVQPLVEQRLAEGYSIKLIFEELADAGRLTMGYTSFCDYIRGKGARRHGPDKKRSKEALEFESGGLSRDRSEKDRSGR